MSVENIPISARESEEFKHGNARDELLATAEKPVFFSMRTRMVKTGRTNTPVCKTENMWGTVKVYASGGENGLHAHTKQDHMFVVMQGSARFYGPNGETRDVGKHEGVLLPKGCYYCFNATSKEPLVLFRVGCHTEEAKDKSLPGRLDIKGGSMPGDHPENAKGAKAAPLVYSDEWFE